MVSIGFLSLMVVKYNSEELQQKELLKSTCRKEQRQESLGRIFVTFQDELLRSK